MAKVTKHDKTPAPRARTRLPPAGTIKGREDQLISLAVDVAEQQLREGTASAQVITHYLKLGTTRELLEQDKLRQENALLQGKVEALASQKRVEDLYAKALNAMRAYQGLDPTDFEEGDEEDDEMLY